MPNIIHITKADDLSISNNQLVMIDEDNNDEKNKISLNDISAIVIENCHCKISAILQLRLVENNIPIIICNERHQPEIHSLGLFNHFQVTLRINEQIEWKKEKKEKLWSRIVENKIENQRALLEYLEKSDVSIERLKTYKENLKKDDVSAEHQEAIASRIYFQELYSNSFKRFDEDGVNSALNYGYMILRAVISSKIVAKGFHPSLGLHHKSQFNSYNFSYNGGNNEYSGPIGDSTVGGNTQNYNNQRFLVGGSRFIEIDNKGKASIDGCVVNCPAVANVTLPANKTLYLSGPLTLGMVAQENGTHLINRGTITDVEEKNSSYIQNTFFY